MADNKIELKSIAELLGMKFFIPGYQRGYRWTEQQVIDLLNDIAEFQEKNTVHTDFYCLQPLVVKECIDNEDDFLNELPNINKDETVEGEDILKQTRKAIANHTKWEVIDGQQRLTTLFLILSYLNISDVFSIKYETRTEFTKFFNYLRNKDLIRNIDLNIETINTVFEGCINECKNYDNIDFYHILTSFATIKCWFSNKDLTPEFNDTLLNRVKFIWYESVEEDPIKVFTRLNIGKISLTNAELIKALFLNQSNFIIDSNDYLKLRQQEIASEWDMIENTLQNDEFWLFLNKIGYNRPTRIDLIFDLICEQNAMKLPVETINAIGTDGYKTFRYFYEYFKLSNALEQDAMHDSKQKTKIELCWSEVKKYFQTFQEWFDDLELYHYIGYLVEYKRSISALVSQWRSSTDKDSFLKYLKSEIKKEIGGCPLDFQYKEDGSDIQRCKPILLLHNVQTVVNQNKNNLNNEDYKLGVFYKFPFHLYKLESWDVEHINSNTTNDEDDIDTQKEWLLNVYLSSNEDIQEKIFDFFEEDNEEQRNNLFNEIKEQFPQTEVWTPEEKNRIWNYTLLNSSTNRSYSNAIFSGKRRVIIGKDKGVSIAIPKISKDGKLQLGVETKAKSAFVPPCTKQVFMKYYSVTMSDANYWTKIDAAEYLRDIEDCISKLEE